MMPLWPDLPLLTLRRTQAAFAALLALLLIGHAFRASAGAVFAAAATASLVAGQWVGRARVLRRRSLSWPSESGRVTSHVRDLEVEVSASHTMPDLYSLTVRNTGSRTLYRLRVLYEPLLLEVENFGVDTPPTNRQQHRPAGHAILIARLAPGQSQHFFRKGCAEAYRFKGLRKSPMDVRLALEADGDADSLQGWCYARVALPNAV